MKEFAAKNFSPAQAPDEEKLVWRQETVSEKLGIGIRTLERWRAIGKFPEPDFRFGAKLLMWKPQTVRDWLEAQAPRYNPRTGRPA